MSAHRIALLVSYDGSYFNGWQIQDNQPTVQGELEKALYKVHKEKTRIIGSGRTDTGVHGIGQVAHFDTKSNIPSEKYAVALNSLLPKSVRILKSVNTNSEFHSRFDAIEREYEYRILYAPYKNPFSDGYSHTINYFPDLHILNRIASKIIGEHDFTTFSAAGDKNKTKIRKIYASSFYVRQNMIIYIIRGNAFLWRMVRSLVGTMLEDERQNGPEYFKDRLDAANRSYSGITAPPEGLYLRRVFYNENIF